MLRRMALALAAILAATVGFAAPAQAAVPSQCGPQWKLTNGQVAVTTTGLVTSVTVSFRLNTAQRAAVQCAGQFMQLYLNVQNAEVSGTDYALSTNLQFAPDRPAEKRRPALASGFEPGVTLVNTYLLAADTPYYFTATWTRPSATQQTVTLYQHASRTAQTMIEKSWCPPSQPLTQRCLFTVEWATRTGPVPLVTDVYPFATM